MTWVRAPPHSTRQILALYGGSATASEQLARFLVVPSLAHDRFLLWLATADVVVDTFPYGGCTSSYEALLVGTPVVTLPSHSQRGRFTAAMLKAMGLSRFVAADHNDLPRLALAVADEMVFGNEPVRKGARDSVRLSAWMAAQSSVATQDWSDLLLRAFAGSARLLADSDAIAWQQSSPGRQYVVRGDLLKEPLMFLADPATAVGDGVELSVSAGTPVPIVAWLSDFCPPDNGPVCVRFNDEAEMCQSVALPSVESLLKATGATSSCARLPQSRRNARFCHQAVDGILRIQGQPRSTQRVLLEFRTTLRNVPTGRHTLTVSARRAQSSASVVATDSVRFTVR